MVDRWVGNPIATYNLLIAASFPATGAATYWVLRRSSASVAGSLIGASALTFAPFRWMHLGHIQILLTPLTPLVLWTFDRLLVERTARRAGLFLLAYLPHVAGGCYVAYMTHLPLAVLALSRLWREPRAFLRPRALGLLGTVALICAGAVATLFLPYAGAAAREGRERAAPEIASYAASAKSFLTSSTRNRYQPIDLFEPEPANRRRGAQALFPGIAATFLAPLGLVVWLRSRRSRRSERLEPAERAERSEGADQVDPPEQSPTIDRAAADLAVWHGALCIGAALALTLTFSGPYLLAARWLPGLDGMRVPARFVAVAWPALALLVAFGADAVLRAIPALAIRLRSGAQWATFAAATAMLALVGIVEAPRPVSWARLAKPSQIPAIHHWLGGPEAAEVGAVLELPLHRNDRGTLAMHHSTVHWKPIANGFSGYEPPTFVELSRSFRQFPGAPAFAVLRRHRITHVLVPRLPGRDAWEGEFLGREVELTKSEADWRLYRVLPASDQVGG